MPKWRIPEKIAAQCLRMAYSKVPHRAIYLHFWPNGTDAPVTPSTFSDALGTLILETENDVERLANIEPNGSRGPRPVLELAERIEEEPLPAEVEFALRSIRTLREKLEGQIDILEKEDPPDIPNRDVKAMRAATISNLSSTINTLVNTEMRAAEMRTDRTMKHLAMRIRIKESQEEASDGTPHQVGVHPSQQSLPKSTAKPLLMLDMPTPSVVSTKK